MEETETVKWCIFKVTQYIFGQVIDRHFHRATAYEKCETSGGLTKGKRHDRGTENNLFFIDARLC